MYPIPGTPYMTPAAPPTAASPLRAETAIVVPSEPMGVPQQTLANPLQTNRNASAAEAITYQVVGIKPHDVLNVREGPGANHRVSFKLRGDDRGITLLDRASQNGAVLWQEIRFGDRQGWVNSQFLSPQPKQ